MRATYFIETYSHHEGGWTWRIVGQTPDYGCEVACSECSFLTQADAKGAGEDYLELMTGT